MATDFIGPILTDYVDQAAAAVNPTPGKIVHTPPGGSVPWDQCDCDGQIWGRVISKTPITGNSRGTAVPCGVLFWDVTMAISIIRCIHVVKENGQQRVHIPTAAEMDGDGARMYQDMADIEEVIMCHSQTSSMGSWTPLGPNGGCAGGEWTFHIRIPVCACP